MEESNQFQLILQAAEMIESEDPRSEENASEDDTDLEEEVETANTQSDSGLTESGQRRQHVRVSGRRRMHSETTNVMEQFSPTSNDERCRQASNLHNEREKERRKDLKFAVHKLRNQLQLRKTKKATTISVLKASEQEIKDLLRMEAAQTRELSELQNRHKHLTWKLENLMAEEGRTDTSQPAACDQPPPPPLTSVDPMIYIPLAPSASRSPPVPCPPHPHAAMMIQSPALPAVSPSSFPFATPGPGLSPFSRFPLLSPTHTFPMAASPHHPFPTHPANRPYFVMPPQSFTFPPFMSHLSTAPGYLPGRFTFPSAAARNFGSSPPPTLFLQSLSPPGALAASQFPYLQQYMAQSTAEHPETSSPQASPITSERVPPESPNLEVSASSSPLEVSSNPCSNQLQSQLSRDATGGEDSSIEDDIIDVDTTDLTQGEGETTEQECDQQAFLDIRTHRPKQRKKEEAEKTSDISFHKQKGRSRPKRDKTEGSKSWKNPPALVNQTGNSDSTVSQIIKRVEPATKVMTQDILTSALEKHGLYIDRDGRNFHSWEKRAKKVTRQTSPSVIDLTPLPHLPPVICS